MMLQADRESRTALRLVLHQAEGKRCYAKCDQQIGISHGLSTRRFIIVRSPYSTCIGALGLSADGRNNRPNDCWHVCSTALSSPILSEMPGPCRCEAEGRCLKQMSSNAAKER
jgi:hypothetical protein